MAHIPDGILSAPVMIGGAVIAGALVAVAVKRLDEHRIPQTALLAAAFFVASLIHIPVGPSSVHPLLGGLMGLILGWAAVPAVLVALTLQAVFFGFGGLTTLGVNTLNIALPALIVAGLFGPALRRCRAPRTAFLIGAGAATLATALTALFVCAALALSGSAYVPALAPIVLSFAPLALVEAVVTGAAVVLVKRVKPELPGLSPAPALSHG